MIDGRVPRAPTGTPGERRSRTGRNRPAQVRASRWCPLLRSQTRHKPLVPEVVGDEEDAATMPHPRRAPGRSPGLPEGYRSALNSAARSRLYTLRGPSSHPRRLPVTARRRTSGSDEPHPCMQSTSSDLQLRVQPQTLHSGFSMLGFGFQNHPIQNPHSKIQNGTTGVPFSSRRAQRPRREPAAAGKEHW